MIFIIKGVYVTDPVSLLSAMRYHRIFTCHPTNVFVVNSVEVARNSIHRLRSCALNNESELLARGITGKTLIT
jgi:hypothetical protein